MPIKATTAQIQKAKEVNGWFRELIRQFKSGFPNYHLTSNNRTLQEQQRNAATILKGQFTAALKLMPDEFFNDIDIRSELFPIVTNTDNLSYEDGTLLW